MPRDSHTISRFSGVNAYDSPMNVKPHYSQDCMNVIGDSSGDLWVARLTQTLIDFTTPANDAVSLGRILSIGLLDDEAGGLPPRIVIQQGSALVIADSPAYANPQVCGGLPLPPNPGRLSYAQSDSVLYFSSGIAGGKLLPGDNQVYRWGIVAPVAPVAEIASTTFLGVVSIQRAGGIVTLAFTLPHGSAVGDPVFVDDDPSATWDPSYAGAFAIASVPNATTVTYVQPGADSGPFARAVFAPGITATTGYQYYGSFGSTKTDHWSTVGPLSSLIGPLTQQSPALFSPLPPDPQVDQFALFRNLDDGGDWYLIGVFPLPAIGVPFPRRTVMIDTTSDDLLEDQSQTPPYANGVSPNGKYIASSVDRTLMCGIAGNLGAVAFSGYDSINFGRPQESWPPFNSIAVGQGQSIPNGLGYTRYGWVIFNTNRALYIIKGTLQDITVSAVQTPSFQLTEFPFKIGCYSHYSIQSTPSGLVFLDDALKLKLFDGYWEPTSFAPVLNGIMKRITPGSQDIVASTYVELLNRKWYILAIPVDGSQVNNITIIIDVDADQDRNTGCWVTSYSLDDIVSVLNQDGTRHILAAQSQSDVAPIIPPKAGWLTELPLLYSATDGLGQMPRAHYLTGYFGIKDEDGVDEWAYTKMFRYLRQTTNLPGITVMAYIVDGADYTFDNPLVQKFDFDGTYGSINLKGRAIALDFIFPPDCADALSAITQAWNNCGKR